MPDSPIQLDYDNTPPGSEVRFEFHDAGVRITVPASAALSPKLRKAAMRWASVVAAWIMLACLFVMVIFAYLAAAPQDPQFRLPAAIAFAIFALALYGFSWRHVYLGRVMMLEQSARVTTVIDATADQLQIESADAGEMSRQVLRSEIAQISIRPGAFLTADLFITLQNGLEIVILKGKEPRDLRRIHLLLTR